jgi:hypothetical protein
MVVVRSRRIRQPIFAIAALGTLLAVASVGFFYVPWLLAMVPAVVSKRSEAFGGRARSVAA